MVTIGFTQEDYTVTENEEIAQVCVGRNDVVLECPIPFNLSTTMKPGEAEGMCVLFKTFSYTYILFNIVLVDNTQMI